MKDNLKAPSLRRRIQLTYQYLGWRTVLFRLVTFPLRATPLKRYLRLQGRGTENAYHRAVAWYREHGRPVDVVIPSYRDAERVATLVASIRRTVPAGAVRVIVADDASGPEHVATLRAIAGIEVVAGEENRGFAANVNRGLRAADPARDVVVLNSDMEARPGWLACLQYAASQEDDVGVVGARLLYPDGRIQFAGTVRNAGAPEWFDHRYRFKPEDWGPAALAGPVLAVTGACMYLTREAIERVGLFDERYPMAYEDVDWCLRAWQASLRVMYFPAASLYHHESVTRGTEVGERERVSQRVFWERWGAFFDEREVRAENGRLRVVYVTEDTGIGGGHRDIFEHLNGLLDRGHDVALYTLGEQPEWFPLRAPGAHVRVLRRTDRGARAARRREGRDVVEHRRAGVARERAARRAGVLRAGHRDLLLPRRRGGAPRGARLLPPRVPLHDDLRVEPRTPARAGPRRRADPPGDRPRHVPPPPGGGAPRRTSCSRWGAPTR